MSNSNGIITAPVSVEDVQTVLGFASNDIGALCESDKVNVFSKVHPIPLQTEDDTPAEIDDAMRKKYHYGINSLGNLTTLDLTIDELTSIINKSGFDYTLVEKRSWNLGYSVHHRLTDFNGYDHNATLQGNDLASTTTTSSNEDRSITPTFAVGNRTLALSNVTENRFRLHNDSLIITHYLSSEFTDAKGDGSGVSLLDIIFQQTRDPNTGAVVALTASAKRYVFFFQKDTGSGLYELQAWARACNNNATTAEYIDLGLSAADKSSEASGNTQHIMSATNFSTWAELAGDFIVCEAYMDTNICCTIAGFAYNLTITRTTVTNTSINSFYTAETKQCQFSFVGVTSEDGGVAIVVAVAMNSGYSLTDFFSSVTVGLYSDAYGKTQISGAPLTAWASLPDDTNSGQKDYIKQWTAATNDVSAYAVIKGTTVEGNEGILSQAVTLKKYN